MGLFDNLKQFADDIHAIAQSQQPAGHGGSPGMASRASTGPVTYPLQGETRSVTLDSNGNGIAQWSPGQPSPGGGSGAARNSGLSVAVANVVASVAPLAGNSAAQNQASATGYLSWGIPNFGSADSLASTAEGSTGDTLSINQTLRPGDWITIQWTGGDAGAIATFTVNGTVTPPGS